jgi:hypothetical protein
MKFPDPADTARSRLLASLLLVALPFLVYIAGFRYMGSGDTAASELLAVSLIREGDFDFNEFFQPGEEMPYAFTWSGDRIVNLYTVIPGLMNVPVFLAAELVGVDLQAHLQVLNKISMSLLAAISVMLMFRILLRIGLSLRRGFFISLVYAFGTLVWSSAARGTWQHGPSILFLCAALLLMLSGDPHRFAWSGFFLALMCVNRPANVFLAGPLFLYIAVHRRRSLPGVLLTALIPLAFLAWYSVEYWGSLLSLGQGQQGKFTGDPLLAVPGMLLSPARGLLVFSPIFIFSFVYLFRDVLRKGGNILYRYMAAGFAITLIGYSFWERWSGGHCFGYRYLSEFIPVFILFLAEGWDRYIARRAWTRAAFTLTLAASVYFNFLGAYIFPSGFDHIPDDIDFHPGRLWSVSDTELTRCHEKLVDFISQRL